MFHAGVTLPIPDLKKIQMQELLGRRKPLWQRFENNPSDLDLALELKLIDDQIAECNAQIQAEKRKPPR
jgi:hypothetical protein